MFKVYVRRNPPIPPETESGWIISEPEEFRPRYRRAEQVGTFEVEDPKFPGSNCLQVNGLTPGHAVHLATADLHRLVREFAATKGLTVR